MNDKKKKREPNCAVCLNHGTRALLKGHKRHCLYRECKCPKCTETKKRQEYMADMQYIKRNGIAEEARLGKRADMIAIYNERMKSKKNKKIGIESEKGPNSNEMDDEGGSKSPDKSITLEKVDSNIQDLLRYFREDLRITEEDDILFHSLVVMVQELDYTASESAYEHVIALYKEL